MMPGLTRRGFFRGILGAIGAAALGKAVTPTAKPEPLPVAYGVGRGPIRGIHAWLDGVPIAVQQVGPREFYFDTPHPMAGRVGTVSYTAHGPIKVGDPVGLRPDGTVESLRRG